MAFSIRLLTSAIRAKALRYVGFGFWQPTAAYLLTFCFSDLLVSVVPTSDRRHSGYRQPSTRSSIMAAADRTGRWLYSVLPFKGSRT
jgi:hypothetical protein